MSSISPFDLDTLNGETFQQLCAALILSDFSPLAVPYGTSGSDGDIDTKHIGMPITYKELLDTPHKLGHVSGYDVFWVFQAKHVRQDRQTDRQRAVVKNLKEEIEKWLCERFDEAAFPTCFVLMTNVRITPTTRKSLEELGQFFEYFECWDEAKLDALLMSRDSIKNQFFPNKDERILNEIRKLTDSVTQHPYKEKKVSAKTTTRKKTRTKTPSTMLSFSLAINNLVEAEKTFVNRNNAISDVFELKSNRDESVTRLPKLTTKAKRKGILALSNNKEALARFIELVKMRNVFPSIWYKYLGEEVEKDESILDFYCHEDFTNEASSLKDKIFKVVDGKNTEHEEVDEYLIALQSKILKSVDEKRYVEAERLLRDLFEVRKEYLLLKKDAPSSFYPNTRTFGSIVSGWDFMDVWNQVYEQIFDVIGRGDHPEDTLRMLLTVPFALCREAIYKDYPLKHYEVGISLLRRVFYEIIHLDFSRMLPWFFQKFEDHCHKVKDSDYSIGSVSQAEMAVEKAFLTASLVFAFLKASLDGKTQISNENLSYYISIITSLDLNRALDHNVLSDDWESSRKRVKELHKKCSLKRYEYYFAWSSYLWFKKRERREFNYADVHKIESQIPITSLVELYEKIKDKEADWFYSWFAPQSRGITVWSSRIDHDIRELLIAALIFRDFSSQDLADLSLLESESSTQDFVKEVKEWHEKLSKDNSSLSNLDDILSKIRAARKEVEEKIKRRIAEATEFDERKIGEIKSSFQRELKTMSAKGFLYDVQEGLNKDDITHYVGVYSLNDKVWYLVDNGHVTHSVHGMGRHWAEAIEGGREQLAIKLLEKELKPNIKSYEELDEFLNNLKGSEQEYCILSSHQTIPWNVSSKHITHNRDDDGRQSYVGKSRLIYNGRFIKSGDLFVIPRSALVWKVVEEVKEPKISIIEPGSDVAKEVQKKNPELDISQKVIVECRELGKMTSSDLLKRASWLRFS